MKKLWILFLSIFAVFGIAACNNDDDNNTTEIEYNLNEQLDVPSNLSVNETSKVFSWDAVEDAVRYNVYVNGELEAEVTTTSFDFSDITGDKLLFTVKAMAPTGITNSNISATIAFVANRESEISKMRLSIQSSSMTVSDEEAFASELVNKGMLSEDFDSMMEGFEDMEAAMELNDMSDIFDELSQFLDSTDMVMVEAIISSVIKVELIGMLNSSLEGEISSNNQLQDLLDYIDEDGDQAVRSAMIVIEYLIEVQEGFNSEFITSMEGIMDTESMEDVNVNLLVSVKDELLNNFKDNLPELQDVIVLNSTMLAIVGILSGEDYDDSIVNVPKQSAQSLMNIELFFNLLIEMDADYIETMLLAGESMEDSSNVKEFIKENIRLIDEFLENNQTLIQEINDIYTDVEKEEMFYDYYMELFLSSYLVMFSSSEINQTLSLLIEEHIDFDHILLLKSSLGDSFNLILDTIIESDYALIDAFFYVEEVSVSTSSQYSDEDMADAVLDLLKETVAVINPVIQNVTSAEYSAMLDLIFGPINIQSELDGTFDSSGMIAYVETVMMNTSSNQLNIIQDLFNILDQTDYMDDFLALYQLGNVGAGSDEYYGAMIIVANAYLEFYDDSENDIDAIIDELILFLGKDAVKSEFDMTDSDIEDLETLLNQFFTDLDQKANVIQDYDYTNLTVLQKENVDNFVIVFSGLIYMMPMGQ